MASIASTLTFLAREPHHDKEKLYELEYNPTDGLPMSNYKSEQVNGVHIHNIRPEKHKLSLDKQGFIISDFSSSAEYEDFWDEEQLKTKFLPGLRQHLISILGARSVYFHETVIRKRDKAFPLRTGETKGYGQPIPLLHFDYTLQEVSNLIRQLCKNRSSEVLERRYQMLNVWKPLRGPVRDWPLVFCDMRTLDSKDITPLDEVHPTAVLESALVYYNPAQKWCYLRDQNTTELVIFKTVDSEVLGSVPHGSFQLPDCPADELPRESLELRCLIVY